MFLYPWTEKFFAFVSGSCYIIKRLCRQAIVLERLGGTSCWELTQV